jgi:hypothetical protein
MEQRLRRLEHRVRHVENQSHLNELKILALEALKWGVGVATWVEKLILDTILGTLIFFFNIWPVILPILILVLAIIVGYYSRHYIWGPLLWLCVVTIKFFLSIYNTFVDIINTVIHFVDKAVSGIITGVTFGIVHRHHVIPPSFEMPKYGIHHALPGDVYTFFTDPVGFCHTRPHGLEMVVGSVINMASPEYCRVCRSLSLAPGLENFCEVIFLGKRFYHYRHTACRPNGLDYVCQALYIDDFASLILGLMMFGLVLISYREAVFEYLKVAFLAVKVGFISLFAVLSVTSFIRRIVQTEVYHTEPDAEQNTQKMSRQTTHTYTSFTHITHNAVMADGPHVLKQLKHTV